MTFSIRSLLAMVVMAALSIAVWRSDQDARREQDRLTKLLADIESAEQEIKSFESRLHLDNPPLHRAIRDEYEAIRKSRKQCDASIDLLREKYGSIEPRGPDVVSIRELPSIRGDKGQTPFAFRVYVPKERTVWLKYGFRDDRKGVTRESSLDDIVGNSPFDHGGPYEEPLMPGFHVLIMTIWDAEADSMSFRISLNSSVLLDSRLKSVSHTGGGYIPAPQQQDINNSKLAEDGWLMSARMTLRDDKEKNPSTSYEFLVWLSDQTSGFSTFPGRQ